MHFFRELMKNQLIRSKTDRYFNELEKEINSNKKRNCIICRTIINDDYKIVKNVVVRLNNKGYKSTLVNCSNGYEIITFLY